MGRGWVEISLAGLFCGGEKGGFWCDGEYMVIGGRYLGLILGNCGSRGFCFPHLLDHRMVKAKVQ